MSKRQCDSALILWDVDHTLVSIGDVSRVIYERAFRSVIGRPLRDLASMTGRTERVIITETLKLNNVEVDSEVVSLFYSALEAASSELEGVIRRSGFSLPGASDAIRTLSGKGVVQSVVTGNIRAIAKMKLEAFDLTGILDLEVGAYGDDGSDRADLVRLARQRAEVNYRTRFSDTRVIVIGDTPHDIKGARDAGVLAVGVATGSSSVATLKECGADLVLADLTNIGALREAISASWEY